MTTTVKRRRHTYDKMPKLMTFLEQNPELKPKVLRDSRNRIPPADILYDRAASAGIHWSDATREWYTGPLRKNTTKLSRVADETTPEEPPAEIAPLLSTQPHDDPEDDVNVKSRYISKDIMLLRVLAHRDRIERYTAAITEFIEFINFEVLDIRVPRPMNGSEDWFVVHIRLRLLGGKEPGV